MADAYPIKEVVNSVVKDIFNKNKTKEADLAGVWDKVIIETLKKKTNNFALLTNFNNGILKVKVVNSSYFYKFVILKSKLIDKFNKQIGKNIIKDIKFNI